MTVQPFNQFLSALLRFCKRVPAENNNLIIRYPDRTIRSWSERVEWEQKQMTEAEKRPKTVWRKFINLKNNNSPCGLFFRIREDK